METQIAEDISIAKAFLQNGEIVAIPTETVYGLAGNALNEHAILEVFKVKQRPSFDPLIVHVKDFDDVMHFVKDISPLAESLMEAFWPGPLTLIFKKKIIIPDIVTSGLDTVGIRMPAHPLTLELLQSLNFPLAAPSANPFGYISPTTAQHVYDQLSGKIPYILNGGSCSVGVESTIVNVEEENCIIYRLGGLTVEAIRKVVGKVELQINSGSNPVASGMMKSHYAPSKPFFLDDNVNNLQLFPDKRIAYISFTGDHGIDKENVSTYILSATGNFSEAARNLFSLLRKLDQSPEVDIIIAKPLPEEDLGKAINDRYRRAAAK